MNPALSVIFFTTASGAGYGVLTLAALLTPLDLLPQGRWFGLAAIGLALVLISAGLLSSTLHLGHPERAWRALSQWRTSWLSREGLVSLLTYIPAGLYILFWLIAGVPGPAITLLGLLAAVGAVATVACTAMIYASLKPIRQWRDDWTLPCYLIFSLFSGGALLAAIASFWRPGGATTALAVVLGLLAVAAKLLYWRSIDTKPVLSTRESATGLGRIGKVRPLDPPHTEENYLLREMGYRIARRHASRLRAIALAAGFVIPIVLLLATLALPPPIRQVTTVLAALLALAGLLVERWLFFAEATHTVMLYYG